MHASSARCVATSVRQQAKSACPLLLVLFTAGSNFGVRTNGGAVEFSVDDRDTFLLARSRTDPDARCIIWYIVGLAFMSDGDCPETRQPLPSTIANVVAKLLVLRSRRTCKA